MQESTSFFFIERIKDGLYYHSTEDGVDTFVSAITLAKHMTKEEAKAFRDAHKKWYGHTMEIRAGTHIE